jgi:hypothetical protein
MEMLRLPLPVSCAFAFRSALDTSVCFLFLATGGRKPAPDLGSWYAGMIRSGFFRGARRLSQLPTRPRCGFALLFDPGRTSTPDHGGALVQPPLSRPRRPHRANFFRGSITRLCSSLPTLEGVISESPAKARFRWSVRPFRAGRYPPGLGRGFLLLVSFLLSVGVASAIPPLRALAGAT